MVPALKSLQSNYAREGVGGNKFRERVTDPVSSKAELANSFLASELVPKPHRFPQNMRVFILSVGFCLQAPKPLTKATISWLWSGLGKCLWSLLLTQRVQAPSRGVWSLTVKTATVPPGTMPAINIFSSERPLCLFVCFSKGCFHESMFLATTKGRGLDLLDKELDLEWQIPYIKGWRWVDQTVCQIKDRKSVV